jgi:LmbE family N-acetylglucosaminyl deacetylase
MFLAGLEQVSRPYRHVYLSPHLDDAALSCGGAIAQAVAAGESVLVVTLCTALPPSDMEFNALAREFHAAWALPPEEVVAARLREEHEAIARLNADNLWANQFDAIYRHPEVYTSRQALFSQPGPHDPLFATLYPYLKKLQQQLPAASYYAPLGVGSHVDHLITHRVAQAVFGTALSFYEDFPYVAVSGALEKRQADLRGTWQSTTIDIQATIATKIHSIAAYTSQLKELFGGAEAMEQAVRAYAEQVGSGQASERVWQQVEA